MNYESFMLPCLSKTLFGFECLGCGFQRSVVLLFQGHFEAAFQMYPAIYTSLILVVFAGLYWINPNPKLKTLVLFTVYLNFIFMIAGYYFKHFL